MLDIVIYYFRLVLLVYLPLDKSGYAYDLQSLFTPPSDTHFCELESLPATTSLPEANVVIWVELIDGPLLTFKLTKVSSTFVLYPAYALSILTAPINTEHIVNNAIFIFLISYITSSLELLFINQLLF